MNWSEFKLNHADAEILAARAADAMRWSVATAVQSISSPIERRLLVGLLVAAPSVPNCPASIMVRTNLEVWFGETSGWQTLTIKSQAPVERYVADFELTIAEDTPQGSVSTCIYIECDGHDFHEKTKKQAAHDKKRDRLFVSKGLTFLRFTGSEIHASAVTCATEALGVLAERHRIATAPIWAAHFGRNRP